MQPRHSFRLAGPLTALGLCLAVAPAPAQDDAAAAFRATCAAKAGAAGQAMAVPGAAGWWFLTNELRHVGAGRFWGDKAAAASQAAKPQEADPLPAILDFKDQLDKLGIELILVPVPPKVVIYPDKLGDAAKPAADGKAPPRLDAAHREFYQLLRGKGVQVLDLTDDFLANREAAEGAMYCQQDTHWSGLACNRAAKRISELLAAKDWYKDAKRAKFHSTTTAVTITGDLWNSLKEADRPPRETLNLRKVTTPAGEIVKPDKSSPVVLLGDSHNLVFHAGDDMHATGAGLADQLALELGLAVDLVAVRGSGATPARINLYRAGRANPQYFAGKKAVVWCFTAREFTESQGWRVVPVAK